MIQIKTFTVNSFGENCYLLYDDTKEAVIIDCGCSSPIEENEISAFITSHQLILKHHLCTHIHVDHLFGAPFIYKKYGLLPEADAKDIQQMPSIQQQAILFGLPRISEDISFGCELHARDCVKFGHSELHVLEVPGHSPGSVAFYAPTIKAVFVGDALFAGSIGRTDFWGGSHEQLIRSIKEQLLTLPDETNVFPGHGPETTIAYEKIHNLFLH